jgi:hypothetical protein
MKQTAQFALVASLAIALSSCSSSKSTLCRGKDVDQAVTEMARQDNRLFEAMRAATDKPPYLNDPRLKELISDLRQSRELITSSTAVVQENVLKCQAINADVTTSRERAILEAFMTLTPGAEKRLLNACRGDFSVWTDDPRIRALVGGEKMFANQYPTRYRFWKEHIYEPVREIEALRQRVYALDRMIRDLNDGYALKAYAAARMTIQSASLEFSNESETVHSCSAILSVEDDGWVPVQENIRYQIKITDDGGKRVVLNE